MPTWLHRTNRNLLVSVPLSDLIEPQANYILWPDLSGVTGFPSKYWTITGDAVTLMSKAERDAVDAAEQSSRRDDISSQMDDTEEIVRAFALTVLDELNNHASKINGILDAIDGANNLGDVKTVVANIADYPLRTIAQLKAVIRTKLGT